MRVDRARKARGWAAQARRLGTRGHTDGGAPRGEMARAPGHEQAHLGRDCEVARARSG